MLSSGKLTLHKNVYFSSWSDHDRNIIIEAIVVMIIRM